MLFAVAAFVLPWLAARAARAPASAWPPRRRGLRIAALDALTGLREVRAFGAEGRMLAAVQAREAALLAAQHALAGRTALAGAGAFLCGQAAIFACCWRPARNPAAAVAAAFLVVAAFEAVGGLPRAGALAGHAVGGRASRAGGRRRAGAGARSGAAGAAARRHRAALRGGAFPLAPDRPTVFDGLTLDVPQGARVALLGPSGAGKSTLAALALKVAAPQSGQGAARRRRHRRRCRRRRARADRLASPGDPPVRRHDPRQPALARPDADDAALWAALDAAQIGDMVRALPDGLDTWVGEGGARFSGGQGRRLALARALLSPAPILILDEPCAGLDAETERAFLATLNEVAAGRSVILIAHRLTGVERLDRIWRLSGGHAVRGGGPSHAPVAATRTLRASPGRHDPDRLQVTSGMQYCSRRRESAMRRLGILILLLCERRPCRRRSAADAPAASSSSVFFQEWSAAIDDALRRDHQRRGLREGASRQRRAGQRLRRPHRQQAANILTVGAARAGRGGPLADRRRATRRGSADRGHGSVQFALTSQESRRVEISVGRPLSGVLQSLLQVARARRTGRTCCAASSASPGSAASRKQVVAPCRRRRRRAGADADRRRQEHLLPGAGAVPARHRGRRFRR